MNKVEFLDMLEDYLLKDFTKEETLEILRDYEEYFINGKLDGKSEEDIVLSLGSPKKIAKDLLNAENTEQIDSFDRVKRKIFNWYENRFYDKLNNNKEKGKQKNILRATFSGIKNIFLIFFKYFVLSFFMAIFTMFLISSLITMIFATFGGVVMAVLLTPVVINALGFLSMPYFWIIFPIILAVGLFIFMSIVILYFSKFIYRVIVEYINWFKIQLMYKKYENISMKGEINEN